MSKLSSRALTSRPAANIALQKAVVETLECRRLLASITGTIYSDANGDGIQNGAESGMSGWTAYIDSNNNGILDAGGSTVASTDVPRTIADVATVNSNLFSSVPGVVADINVTVNLTHTFDADLDIFLISPSGTRVELSTDNGGSGDNFTNTVFDDQASTSIVSGFAPMTGSFRPETVLSAVNGQAATGTWKLEITDDQGGDTGTLTSWSIAITTASEVSETTSGSGTYTFVGLAAGTYSVRSVAKPGFAQTAPAGATSVTLTSSSETRTGVNFGFAEAGIFGNVYLDSSLDGTRQAGEMGMSGCAVFLDTNNNGTLDGSVPFVSPDVPKSIVDGTTFLSANSVTGLSGTIIDVNVTVNITHTYDPDLDLYLVSPTGTRIELSTDNGTGANYTNTTFDDSASTSISLGSAPFTGSFQPEGLLSAVNGQAPNGAWKLEVTDDAGGDVGSLTSWSLAIATTTSGTPETYALTDSSGNFAIKNVPAGAYKLRTRLQPTYFQSQPSPGTPYNITLSANGRSTGNAFGVYQTPISIGGKLYYDANANRFQDPGESPLNGFSVYIDSNNDSAYNSGEQATFTVADGSYSFPNLQPGTYIVRAIGLNGWLQTSPGSGPIPQERGGGANLVVGGPSDAATVKGTRNVPAKFKLEYPTHDLKYTNDEIVVSIAAPATTIRSANARRVLQSKTASKVNNATSSVLLNFPDRTVLMLKLNDGVNLESLLSDLQRTPGVIYAQPNYIYNNPDGLLDFTPNDPQYSSQYHHTKMQNDLAWNTTIGSPNVIVAVTDDGVSITHPDLAPNIWVNADEIAGNGIDDDHNGYIDDRNGWDFANNNNDPTPNGDGVHGTHVSGIIAARTNNSVGVAGTAGGATIMPLQYYDYLGLTSATTTATYKYAADNGAKIISTSITIDQFVGDNLFADGLTYAYQAGLLHLNSSGNNGELNPGRQSFDQLIFVGSTGTTDAMSYFSNYGYGIDLMAPGENILSTLPGNTYGLDTGTSMSTPNAAGVAALIWSAHPTWTRDQVAAALIGSADNIDALNPNTIGLMGSGRVNSYKAVTQTIPPPRIRGTTLPAEGSLQTTAFSSFTVDVANVFSSASINNSANFSFRGNGPDNVFGTSDDVVIPFTRATNYRIGTNRLTFSVDSTMPKDTYRFQAGTGLVDPFGQSIDGNGNGVGGDSYTRTFDFEVPTSPNTYSATTTTADFGFYFAPRIGSEGNDNWYVRRSFDGTKIEIFENKPGYTPTGFSIPYTGAKLGFNGYDGSDTVTLDLEFGNPIPVGGITFDGGTDANVLGIYGTSGNDAVALTSSTATISGNVLSFTGVTTPTFDGGAGFDTLSINGGTYTFNADAVSTSDHLSVSVASGAQVVFNTTQHLEALSLAANSTATIAPATNSVLVVKDLAIAGGTTPTATLNIGDNDLIVNYSGPVESKRTTVQAQIKAGRGTFNGRYYLQNGFGIRSSSAASTNTASGFDKFAIGAIDNADFAVATGAAKTTFSGETIDASSLLISHTRNGDANLDGIISSADYTLINKGFAGTIANTGWLSGDFNFDGLINASDYAIIDFGNLFH